MKRLRVLMSRQEIVPERLAGATAVVIDVLLATTTLLAILENGASRVFPAKSLEEAESVRERLDAARLLRGGEQGAERIEGYDLGPFPGEYSPEVVEDKDVVFVTSNGTRTIGAVARADRVVISCLRNAPAVAQHLEESSDSVYLVCSGAGGRFNVEDFLGAAAIIAHMDTSGWQLNDAAWLARDFAERHEGRFQEAMKRGRAGRWFFENDAVETFDFVADVGASEVIPEVRDGRLWRIGEPTVEAETA